MDEVSRFWRRGIDRRGEVYIPHHVLLCDDSFFFPCFLWFFLYYILTAVIHWAGSCRSIGFYILLCERFIPCICTLPVCGTRPRRSKRGREGEEIRLRGCVK